MLVTVFGAIVFCAAITLMLLSAVAFIQDNRFFADVLVMSITCRLALSFIIIPSDSARIRLNSDGYPQLWLRATNDRGMNSLLIYREYTDENGTLQQKLYTRYPLNGEKISVRYRTLTEPGAYSVVISDTAGEYQTFGVLTITLLELQNAFSGAEPK